MCRMQCHHIMIISSFTLRNIFYPSMKLDSGQNKNSVLELNHRSNIHNFLPSLLNYLKKSFSNTQKRWWLLCPAEKKSNNTISHPNISTCGCWWKILNYRAAMQPQSHKLPFFPQLIEKRQKWSKKGQNLVWKWIDDERGTKRHRGDKKGVKRGRNDDKGGRNVAALVIVTYSDPLDSCFCLIWHLYLSPHHQPKTRWPDLLIQTVKKSFLIFPNIVGWSQLSTNDRAVKAD